MSQQQRWPRHRQCRCRHHQQPPIPSASPPAPPPSRRGEAEDDDDDDDDLSTPAAPNRLSVLHPTPPPPHHAAFGEAPFDEEDEEEAPNTMESAASKRHDRSLLRLCVSNWRQATLSSRRLSVLAAQDALSRMQSMFTDSALVERRALAELVIMCRSLAECEDGIDLQKSEERRRETIVSLDAGARSSSSAFETALKAAEAEEAGRRVSQAAAVPSLRQNGEMPPSSSAPQVVEVIKSVPVEVVKEVRVEVPVERIVEVEKIVYRDAPPPQEVVKEVEKIVEVPTSRSLKRWRGEWRCRRGGA